MTTLILSERQYTLPAAYTVRPTTLDDAEAVAQVYTEASRMRGDNELFDAEDIRKEWKREEFHLANSSRVVLDAEGQIVATVTVWDYAPPPVHPWVEWDVINIPERQAVALYLLEWGEERARQAIDRCPPEARVSFKSGTLSTCKPDKALLETFGMTPLRCFSRMMITLQEEPQVPVLPNGISIRTFNYPDELPRLVAARDEAWRDHFGYVERPLEENLKEWRHWLENDKLFDPSLWYLAIDNESGEIASIVLCRREEWGNPDCGYVNIVATRRPWRGRGLAQALLQHGFRELWQRGRNVITLYVDDSSPTGATRLYERVGMHINRQYIQYEKELRPGVELANQ